MSILFCENLIWACFNLGEEFTSVILNCFCNLLACFSSMIVFLGLGEADSEWEVSIDCFEIGLDGLEKGRLWVLLDLCGFGSSCFVGCNIGISNGVSSNIGKSSEILMSMRMTVMSSKGSQLCSLSLWEEEGSDNYCEFHFFINYLYIFYNNFHCYHRS